MSIKAVIFDLGGVINRTEDPAPRAQLAARLGITPEELYRIMFDSETAEQATVGTIHIEDHMQAVARMLHLKDGELNGTWDFFWSGDRVDMVLVDYLRGLRGRYTTALLSNAWDDLRRVITGRWKIDDAFDEMIISSEVGLAKPDPKIYHLALSRLGLAAEEAVFVDDFERNIRAAREVGLQTVHFRSQPQALKELEELLNGRV
jgi:epoxide hydrolase-like predicted phosphatase